MDWRAPRRSWRVRATHATTVFTLAVTAALGSAVAGADGGGRRLSATAGQNAVRPQLPPSPETSADPIDDPELLGELAELSAPSGTPPDGATVTVEVLHGDAGVSLGEVTEAIEDAGGTVTGSAPGTLVQAEVPAATVDQLATTPGVGYVRSARTIAVPARSGPAPAASVPGSDPSTAVNADAWHAAGHTGAGVRVGVLDFFDSSLTGFSGLHGTFCQDRGQPCAITSGGTAHGVAVAEVIRDIAPGAQFYAASAGTLSDLYDVIDWFAANGVRVVNSSLGFSYDGPGDGTGPLDDAASYATGKGITWFNAVGNEGSGAYWRATVTADSFDPSGYFRFPDGQTAMSLFSPFLAGCGYNTWILGARWSDWGAPATRTNYDFELWRGGVRVYPTTAGPDQQAGAPPIELDNVSGCNSANDVSVRIRRVEPGSGTIGDVLELQTYRGQPEFWQTAYSAANPIADSKDPAVVAVGAVDDDARVVAAFSSQGPTNDNRVKPDVSAVSCLNSTYYPGCFDGTSAATPVATGVAALGLAAGRAVGGRELAAVVKHDVIDRGAPGPDNAYGTGDIYLPAPPTGTVDTTPGVYTAITPVRLLDSRPSSAILPAGVPAGPYAPYTIVDVPIAGPGLPVPSSATAVAINVTDVGSRQPGYIQAFPTLRAPVGGSSTLNLAAVDQVLPNFTLVPVGENGRISVYTDAGGSLLIDVFGYFAPAGAAAAGRYEPLTPTRVLDTRQTTASLLPDGWVAHTPSHGEVVTVPFRASSGLPDSGVAAVVLTVTGVDPVLPGYVTAWGAVGERPNVSTLNIGPGAAVANSVILPFDPSSRSIRLYTERGNHLIVDLVGYITDASAPVSTRGLFVPVGPNRLFDTRSGFGALGDDWYVTLAVAGQAGVPASGVSAVSLNATATQQRTAWGYLTLVPAGVDPVAASVSNLNWSSPYTDLANGAIVPLGPPENPSRVTAYVLSSTHLIFDVNGYFTS